MNPRTDQPVLRTRPGDRRLVAVRAFVLVAIVLMAAAAVLVVLALRRPQSAPASPSPAKPVTAEGTPPPPPPASEPRINEYVSRNSWVVEVVSPGCKPEFRVDYSPLTRRPELIVSWSPTEGTSADDGRRYSRREYRPVAYTRTVILPEGVTTPVATWINGILTLTFPFQVITPPLSD
jgi:HSP20 family molecular chaperone IbpA